jgi:protein-L-isoaspartate(D-aspartate) O-methyltransferase
MGLWKIIRYWKRSVDAMSFFSKSGKWSEENYLRARDIMVERQLAGRDVRNPDVLEAMRRVPRHLFVPSELRHEAYDDSPLPIGCGQTISQPYIVASMTEHLDPDKSKSVYEVGTGSGYQTAILAELFETVVTVEYYADLSVGARDILTRLGYSNVEFHVGDALVLPLGEKQFDAIIVTAAPDQIPQGLIDRLAPGGKMMIPVGSGIQYLQRVIKDQSGKVDIESLYPVRFVPLQH